MSVQHLPLFHAEVCRGLMTTPPYSTLFPLLPSDVVEIQSQLLNEVSSHLWFSLGGTKLASFPGLLKLSFVCLCLLDSPQKSLPLGHYGFHVGKPWTSGLRYADSSISDQYQGRVTGRRGEGGRGRGSAPHVVVVLLCHW